uniref:Translation initiation factor IF-2, chloroplastic n=1 Tax=Batrachospermum sp. TaxID=31373 RepID=A0A8K1YUQ4_9FLOR|nr:translation initiation factor 2 [Batrachospermum sp.]
MMISSTIDPIKQLDPILKENRENSLLQRIEKKNKYQHKTIDILDPQKNKSKLKKKIRAKIHIGEEEDNIETNYIESDTIKANNITSLPLMRPVKNLKRKIRDNKTPVNSEIKTGKSISKNLKNISMPLTQKVSENKISLNSSLSIQELSSILLIPEAEIIKWLFLQGISITVNQIIDTSIMQSIAEHYGFIIENENHNNTILETEQFAYTNESNEFLEYRAPIITILGHVDHGKTTLLDAMCKTDNVNFEVGGITQAISTHEIEIENQSIKKKIVLLDTPGHEAFSDMRIRCAQVTDICILVIAADDSLQPQSIEVIQYIQSNHIPFIVVINKIDKSNVNILKVKEDLTKYNIISKDWGGDIPIVEVSALTNKNIDLLFDTIIKLAELQELKANVHTNARGSILDAYLDKSKGPVATILIKNGTLKIGNFIIVDNFISKIRAIINTKQLKLDSAGPSSIVEIWGLSNIPISGSIFETTYDEKQAKKILSDTTNLNYKVISQGKNLNNRVRLDSAKKNKLKVSNEQINLILKTDTHGSIDAIIQAFTKIPQQKVQLNILSVTVGKISESDLQLASISKSILVGFNIIPDNNIKITADKLGIVICNFKVIYDLINYIQEQMLCLVKIEYQEMIIGLAIVENIFNVSKGLVAGCIVQSGQLKHHAYIRVKRNKLVIYDGKIDSLKRVKEDVQEVKSGNECGILISNFIQWERKDEIESYELIPKEKALE